MKAFGLLPGRSTSLISIQNSVARRWKMQMKQKLPNQVKKFNDPTILHSITREDIRKNRCFRSRPCQCLINNSCRERKSFCIVEDLQKLIKNLSSNRETFIELQVGAQPQQCVQLSSSPAELTNRFWILCRKQVVHSSILHIVVCFLQQMVALKQACCRC